MFPSIFATIPIVVGSGSIVGTFYCSVCLLPTGPAFFIGFYFIFISWLHMLTLGFASAKSHPQDQLIRAELSLNGSSVPLSESTSKLSSHQIPRCLRVHYS